MTPEEIQNLFELPIRFAAECVSDFRCVPAGNDDCCCQEKNLKPSNDGLDYAVLFLTMAVDGRETTSDICVVPEDEEIVQ